MGIIKFKIWNQDKSLLLENQLQHSRESMLFFSSTHWISLSYAQLKSFSSLTKRLNSMLLIPKLSHAQSILTSLIKNGLRRIERREDSVKCKSQCSLISAIKFQKITDASLKTVVMPVLLSELLTLLMEMEF